MKTYIHEFNLKNIQIPISTKKGSNGVLLIIGGSDLYTGAPYFVSKGAFLTGTELVYIICCGNQNATQSLKILSPESIVISIHYFDTKKHSFILKRATSIVFGSGLSRPDQVIVSKIEEILDFCKNQSKALNFIVDGDGFYFLHKYTEIKIKNKIITPNQNEMKFVHGIKETGDITLQKGKIDILSTETQSKYIETPSGEKRCGGLGDILVGVISSFTNYYEKEEAVLNAALLIRECTNRAFIIKKYSLLPDDIFEELRLFIAENTN